MIGRWSRTPAFFRAIAVVVLGLGLGLSAGRPDLVVLVAPVALLLTGALIARPQRVEKMADPYADSAVAAGIVAGASVGVRTAMDDLVAAELATVRLPDTTARPTGAARTVAGGGAVDLETAVETRSWGPTMIARPDLMTIGPDGLFVAGPITADEVWELVLPAVPVQAPLPLPPINGGWAGAHLSRRPGQGSDLIDLRDYAPGDKMRAVHWRAFARRGKLYTRRTLSDADADLVLCLDIRQNIGPRLPSPPDTALQRLTAGLADVLKGWRDLRSARAGGPGRKQRLDAEEQARYSSLDQTVRAASAIASAQLGVGDRVGLMTTGVDRTSLRPGTGTRQLQRIRYYLARLTSTHQRIVPVAHWGLRPGAVVILCSPLADDQAAGAAVDCAARGHRVVVVDTLPLDEIVRAAVGRDADHLRLLVLQREVRLEIVRRAGIPVLGWESGRIDVQLAMALKATRDRR